MLGAILFWIIVGLIAGALAKWVLPGNDPGGTVLTIIIGIVGAVIGGDGPRSLCLRGGGGPGAGGGGKIAGVFCAGVFLYLFSGGA